VLAERRIASARQSALEHCDRDDGLYLRERWSTTPPPHCYFRASQWFATAVLYFAMGECYLFKLPNEVVVA
jgi:protein associated with RNAse G/E